jgi:hypothetical protein
MMRDEPSLSSRFLFFILTLLLLLILRFVIPLDMKSQVVEDQSLLLQLMEKSGARPESVTLNYGNMTMEGMSKEDILSAGRELERLFSITLRQVSTAEQMDVLKFQAEKSMDAVTTLRVIWVGNRSKPSEFFDGYLLVDVKSTQVNRAAIQELSSFMFDKLGKLSIEPELNTSLEGYVPRKMSVDEQSQWVQKLFETITVTNIEGTAQESLVSYSGYSKRLYRYIGSGNRINIQVATHVDHETGRTMLTIGSPVITVEI